MYRSTSMLDMCTLDTALAGQCYVNPQFVKLWCSSSEAIRNRHHAVTICEETNNDFELAGDGRVALEVFC